MDSAPPHSCANCARLHEQVRVLDQAVATLTEQVRLLQQKLAAAGKDSSTSSKPPSSDLVKPPKPDPPPGQAHRNPGGQPGHPKHHRAAFPPEQVDASFDYTLDACPDCGHAVQPVPGTPHRVQQVDLPLPLDVRVEEHNGHPAWCPHCLKIHYAPLPAPVQTGGLVGPNLTTLIGYLKGACHASFSTVRKFLKDVLGLSISRGQLAKLITKVSTALAAPYQELLDAVPAAAVLNVDETGHKDNGQPWWTWCFRAELYTLFKVERHRSADVLLEVLGEEFDGVLGCDHFSAYRRYLREVDATVQFCLAHLIRDVRYLQTLPGVEEVMYGTRLCLSLEQLFSVIHRREEMTPAAFQEQLAAARDRVLWAGGVEVPAGSKPCQTMAKRLARYGEAYFTFVTTPGVGPTNNLAEQAIRFVVLDRVVTQGTRGEAGREWSERIWSVMASCSQQGRSVFDYLREAVGASFAGNPGPSLLPGGA